MTGLPLDGLLSVQDVAAHLGLSTKTVRRMITRGDLPVTHRIGHSIRVPAKSVTTILASSVTSSATPTVAMNNDNNDGGANGAPRLFRQRGKSKVWTALINNQEVPLGTNDKKEAERKLASFAGQGPLEGGHRFSWRVHPRDGGFAVTYYDAKGTRRLHRVPAASAKSAEQAEAYAEQWFTKHVQRAGHAAPENRRGQPLLENRTTFEQFARLWTSGKLAKRFPDHVKEKRSANHDDQRLKLYVYPVVGAEPMSAFEGRRGLELVEKVQAAMPPVSKTFTRGSRRQVVQAMHRVLVLAVYPAKLIAANPLPKGFLPKVESNKAKSYLYPDEDAKLMACKEVPLVMRLCFGLLIREGFRMGELLGLTWANVDLDRGVVYLDENKTDDPRSWVLDPGVVEALRRWKKHFTGSSSPTARVLGTRAAQRMDRYEMAALLREGLKQAGVDRPQLFEKTETRLPLRAHDLRASFVTVNLALGKSEAWITDRTGHRSSQMIYKYKRQARTHAELDLGAFKALHEAIPELSEKGAEG